MPGVGPGVAEAFDGDVVAFEFAEAGPLFLGVENVEILPLRKTSPLIQAIIRPKSNPSRTARQSHPLPIFLPMYLLIIADKCRVPVMIDCQVPPSSPLLRHVDYPLAITVIKRGDSIAPIVKVLFRSDPDGI